MKPTKRNLINEAKRQIKRGQANGDVLRVANEIRKLQGKYGHLPELTEENTKGLL